MYMCLFVMAREVKQIFKAVKKIMLSGYSAPDFEVVELVVERGYDNSPNVGNEDIGDFEEL